MNFMNHDARFALAAKYATSDDYEAALEHLAALATSRRRIAETGTPHHARIGGDPRTGPHLEPPPSNPLFRSANRAATLTGTLPVRNLRRLVKWFGYAALGAALTAPVDAHAAKREKTQSPDTNTAGSAEYLPHASIDAVVLGVPLYPGAKTRQAGQWRLSDPLGESAQSMVTAALYTDDPIVRVKEFYIEALVAPLENVYEFVSRDGLVISITREFSGGATTNVLLTENPKTKGTRISINRMINR